MLFCHARLMESHVITGLAVPMTDLKKPVELVDNRKFVILGL